MLRTELDADEAVLDGEMVAIVDGSPCFETCMLRFQAGKSAEKLSKIHPCVYMTFDILYYNGEDLTKRKLSERLEILERVINPSDAIAVCESYEDGEQLFAAVKKLGWEGIVSKKKDSLVYLDKRSPDILKIKNYQYDVVQIQGIRKAEFGWSLLKDQRYVGIMEFVPPKERKAFFHIAQQIIRSEDKNWIYLHPHIQCKIKFQAYTKKGLMRSPSFVEFVL